MTIRWLTAFAFLKFSTCLVEGQGAVASVLDTQMFAGEMLKVSAHSPMGVKRTVCGAPTAPPASLVNVTNRFMVIVDNPATGAPGRPGGATGAALSGFMKNTVT